MKNTFSLLGFLVLMACQQHENELVGHWHVEYEDTSINPLNREYFTIDIFEDSSTHLNSLDFWGGIGGWSYQNKNQLYFGGECYHRNFSYRLKNNKLYFKEGLWFDQQLKKRFINFWNREEKESYDYEDRFKQNILFVATKHHIDLCDKQKAYFQSLEIDIDLPSFQLENLDTLSFRPLTTQLFFGLPKKELRDTLGEAHLLLYNFKTIAFDSLEKAEEFEELTLSMFDDRKRKIVIYADIKTPLSTIHPVLDFYQKHEFSIVYFALRQENVLEPMDIKLKKIDIRSVDWKAVIGSEFGTWITNI